MGPEFFLGLLAFRKVREMLEIEGIPQRTVFRNASAFLTVFLPFHIADLGAFDRTPPGTVSVYNSFPGDADIVPFGGTYRRASALAVHELFLVGGKKDYCTPVQMKVDCIFENDGAREPQTFRHVQMPSPLLRKGGNGLAESFRIGSHTVRNSAVIGKGNIIVRDNRLILSPKTERQKDKKDCEDSFHCFK